MKQPFHKRCFDDDDDDDDTVWLRSMNSSLRTRFTKNR